jgi:hypothetical protein
LRSTTLSGSVCLLTGALWGVAGAVAIATVSPVSLRPKTRFDTDAERALAFFLLGSLAAARSPSRPIRTLMTIVGAVVALEAAQTMTTDRHARVGDLVTKIAGTIFGFAFGQGIDRRHRTRPARR